MPIWRTLLVVGSFLTSALAWACPDLAGKYSCPYSGGTVVLEISQEVNDRGFTVYQAGGDELVADGIVKQLPDEPPFIDQTAKASCRSGELVLVYKSTFVDLASGEKVGRLESVTKFSRDADGRLVDVSYGSVVVEDETEPMPVETTVCQRLD